MADPTCAIGCADEDLILPNFEQDDCTVAAVFGQISELFLAIPGHPLVTGDLAELTTRFAAADATQIVRVLVRGDRPRSTAAAPLLRSNGRRIAVPGEKSLNITIDDVTPANHEAVRQIQCGGNFLMWYKTYEGKFYFGGLGGIKAFIDIDMVIPGETTDSMTYQGTATWTAKFMEEMLLYPLAA